ncbi:MAG: hypothetical protein RLZZ175_2907 [Bacteroidota bacterium]|jgi:hypothetical protein
MKTKNELLSYLWLFALLNYLYCDVVGIMDSSLLKQYLTGHVNGMEISSSFLFAASILMEIPIAMMLISKFTSFEFNKWSNLVAGSVMTIVQTSTLVMGTPTAYYIFFSIIEIATTISICYISYNWKNQI